MQDWLKWAGIGAGVLGAGVALDQTRTKFQDAGTNAMMGIKGENNNGVVDASDVEAAAKRAWEAADGDGDGKLEFWNGEKSAVKDAYGIKFGALTKVDEEKFIAAYKSQATGAGMIGKSIAELQAAQAAAQQPAYNPSQFGYNPGGTLWPTFDYDPNFSAFGAQQPSMAQNIVPNQGNQRGQGIWNFLLGGLQGLLGGQNGRNNGGLWS